MPNLKKMNVKKLYLLMLLIILIAIVAGLISTKMKQNPQPEDKNVEIEERIQQNHKLALQEMKERDRMEYYVGIFLEYIENGKYEKAYDLLYEEFKKTYFPTLKSFEEYIPKIFTDMNDIKHENIERNGDVYVLWLSITDAINGKPGEQKEMNIVIKENDYNDFVVSFSVI